MEPTTRFLDHKPGEFRIYIGTKKCQIINWFKGLANISLLNVNIFIIAASIDP